MNILVNGGTGTVGSYVVRELLARNADVSVLTRDPSNAANLPAGVTPAGHTYDLVGTEAMSGESTARAWSRALHKEIKYAGNDLDAWE